MTLDFQVEYSYPSGAWRWRHPGGQWHEFTEPHSLIESVRGSVIRTLKPQLREDMVHVEHEANRWNHFQRTRLLKGDRDRCYFCGSHTDKRSASRDHLWPRSKGGTVVVLSCQNCNRAKGCLIPEEFRFLRYGSSSVEFFGETAMRQGTPLHDPRAERARATLSP